MNVNIKILIGALLLVSTFVANRCVAAAHDLASDQIAQRAKQYRNYRYPMAALGKKAQENRFAKSAALRAANKQKLCAKKRQILSLAVTADALAELLSQHQEVPVVAPVALPAAGGQLARLLSQGSAPASVSSAWNAVPAVSFGDAGGAGSGFNAAALIAEVGKPIETVNPLLRAVQNRRPVRDAAAAGAPSMYSTPPRAGTPAGPHTVPDLSLPDPSLPINCELNTDFVSGRAVGVCHFIGNSGEPVGERRLHPPIFARIIFEDGLASDDGEEALPPRR